ncbi:MAG: Gfo/Idh/MocA family oxidoreductase [Planctomycetes bacterium]|nr:Gfo/Idh/MocA family oxidoreductase [Planctomycetota bacterium]
MRIGVIGLDSSHTLAFGRRIHELHSNGRTAYRVTYCWDVPTPLGLTQSGITELYSALASLGMRFAASLEELLSNVDAVMVLTVDGHRHHDLAIEAMSRGLPIFVDKPLTCSAAQAVSILEYTRTHAARCYSASALRFAGGVPDSATGSFGRVLAIDVTAPFEENTHMRGFWYYGCHAFELIDSLWTVEGGLGRVRATQDPVNHVIQLEYRDGRTASIGLHRSGTGPFAGRLHGSNGAVGFTADLAPAYDGLVASMLRFFSGVGPEIRLERIVESIRAIECCHRSIDGGGIWIDLEAGSGA